MYKYEIIANDIRSKIEQNDYATNEQLPDEKTLADKYDCSRMTIKRAMDILVSEGLIIKSRGLGTFVRPKYKANEGNKRYSTSPNTFGFTKNFETYENKKTEVKDFQVIEATDEVAARLHILPGDFVYSIIRVRYLDDISVILEELFMPIDTITGLNRTIVENSLYTYIEKELNIKIYNADKVIRATLATGMVKEYLNLKEGSPVIELEHVVYSQNNIPIEYAILHYRGDNYELHFVSNKE